MPYKDPQKAKERRERYYIEHREEIRAKARKYYAEHPEIKKAQGKRWYAEHRDERLKWNFENKEKRAEYYITHREEAKEKNKQRRILLRLDVFGHYGGKCAFCGDANPNHLSVDHINNNGAEHRRSMGDAKSRFYRWLKENNYPEGYQLLCFTHNFEKGHYGTMTPMEFENG
jgi:hypothetical protein